MLIHLPTPHDHFSPRTGSAIMTVIDGLARGAGGTGSSVLVAEGTYPEHYDSASVVPYDAGQWLGAKQARLDSVLARAGLGRPFRARQYRGAMDVLPAGPHTLLMHNAPFAGRLAPEQAAPVLYAHNLVLPGHDRAVARAVEGVAAIVAVSDWLADRLRARLPRSLRDRVLTNLNGVDLEQFSVVERGERDRINVLFLGRAIEAKGPDLLVSAVARLARPTVDLRVVGSHGFDAGAALTQYERTLRGLARNVAGGVEFVPFVKRPDVARQFAWADIVVVPSRMHDPCPLALLEAMATGAAVIVTDSGGMPQQAADAAVVVPRGDVAALAHALDGLVGDPAGRTKLGARARRRAEQLSWTNQARTLDEQLAALGLPTSRK